MKALVTGGAGFVGHYLVNRILTHTDWDVIILDKLSYAARGLDRLREIGAFGNPRIKILTADLAQPISYGVAREIGKLDYIFHLAAESHVDKSVQDPMEFVCSNVVGTANILQFGNELFKPPLFVYFSTDEVFGPATSRAFKVLDRHLPMNPYAATKAAGEDIVLAWSNTYAMNVKIVRCMNVFGYRQHPEKFIPLAIKKMLQDETINIHTSKDGIIGSRYYIHAEDVAQILLDTVDNDRLIENIAGVKEVDNLEMAQFIAETLDKELKYELVSFDLGQSSHDLRYELDPTELAFWVDEEEGFNDQLRDVILWTANHKEWLEWK